MKQLCVCLNPETEMGANCAAWTLHYFALPGRLFPGLHSVSCGVLLAGRFTVSCLFEQGVQLGLSEDLHLSGAVRCS